VCAIVRVVEKCWRLVKPALPQAFLVRVASFLLLHGFAFWLRVTLRSVIQWLRWDNCCGQFRTRTPRTCSMAVSRFNCMKQLIESKQEPAAAHHHKTTATQLDPHVRVAASSARRTPPLSNTLHSPGLRTSHSLELVSHCLGFCFYAARTSTVWYLVCAHHTSNEVPRLHAPDAPSPCPCADTVSAQ